MHLYVGSRRGEPPRAGISGPGVVKSMPCRDPDRCGAMRPLLPGVTKQEVFCPTCQFKYHEPGCIFHYAWNPDERVEQEHEARSNSNFAKTQHACDWPGCSRWAGKRGHYCTEHAGVVSQGIKPGTPEARWMR